MYERRSPAQEHGEMGVPSKDLKSGKFLLKPLATLTNCAERDSNQSGNPSFRRFSAIRSKVVPEKTIACLYFEIVKSG